jgi:hypothetical protein
MSAAVAGATSHGQPQEPAKRWQAATRQAVSGGPDVVYGSMSSIRLGMAPGDAGEDIGELARVVRRR